MRLHILLDDELLRQIDEVAGSRGRSAFVREAISRELDVRRRLESLRSAIGRAPDFAAHLPADWVRRERRQDERRFG